MITPLIKKNIHFGILFTSIFTPIIFFMMGLPMILQMKGFDASIIGLFQIVGIPTVLKFLLAPPVDKIIFEKNHYKKWIFFTGIIYVVLLMSISFLSLEDNIYLVFTAIFITAIISTFIDIPINALAIKVFNKEEHISAGSYKISAYSLSGLLGGGVFLLFYNHLGWSDTFRLMAMMVLVSLIVLYFIEEVDTKIENQKVSFKTIISFFKQKDIGIWVFILSFYFAFISAIFVFLKPYFISKGITPDDVAIYVGIYGGIIGILGGILASKISVSFSKKTLLLVFMMFNILSTIILILADKFELNLSYLLLCVTFTALAISLSSAIIFSMIMDYSRQNSRAVDYAVQSSLFAFSRILSAVIAGILVSSIGYEGMFLVEALAMGIVTLLIYKKYA
jgi:MFS transporter, PAT family, beta-lactamase induction signal transducer AmpG